MQASQWTTEIIVICVIAALASLVLGYVVAALRQGRQLSRLAVELEQAQQAQASAVAAGTALGEQLRAADARTQELQVAESALKAKLQAALNNEARLSHEQQEAKDRYATLEIKLEQSTKQHHQAVTQHETAQTEVRSLKANVEDYQKRLELAQADLQKEREAVSQLKSELAQEGKNAKGFEEANNEARAQLADLKGQLKDADQKLETLQGEFAEIKRLETKLKAELAEREASHARELANFEQQKASLSEHFKVLSNEILEAKTKSLQESSQLSLSAVMNPFQQSIDTFKREVQEIHHRETTQQGELRKELESLKALNQQITTEAHELSTALRGQKKLQGNWGELVLENVLDRSGLQLGKDYLREVSITTEEGRQRPDAVVYLPQGKHLIIDAKVSLNAYTRYVNAEDELERKQALKEHVQAVASRIRELADRDYYKLPGLNSPDMVFMFIPIESAFVEALKADETLFQQAIENNVLVATPTTLLTSLNIVRQLWRYEDQNKHTAALASRAEAVFKKLNTFLASFEKIKKGLENATEAYVKAEGQLVSGKGNLVKQVGEFKNLAPAIKAQLPAYFADKAALEIDFIPAEQNITALIDSADDEDLLAETDTETDYETA
ncbi:DNA recombination protein RmuC [Pseudomonas aeruginosa]|uniref:DNA recombination protein RmuC n=1 Tax=Pseudomonas TaxID=286 RepID=UPI0011B49BA0|nr:DNA recombination protein RmuC [Pseudomonas aeruginosa]MBX6714057.1 DNA recombination protein RmuC [Pseudomonas aeruginosa]MDP5445401.1 DNA recombination protein RmuC [Pseudomonas aeruginosa]MDY1524629.1 DNA recombination protein RmuC [Pseudomonas aeruginosa]MDY1537903.1 DNA recombination protein RmuC [Pseudomonas aeruginosa]TWV95599.1 DNA recombination protein RmuC [Pseudomonas aeruginosa]